MKKLYNRNKELEEFHQSALKQSEVSVASDHESSSVNKLNFGSPSISSAAKPTSSDNRNNSIEILDS